MDVQELERVMDRCLAEALETGQDPLEYLTDCIDRWLAEQAFQYVRKGRSQPAN